LPRSTLHADPDAARDPVLADEQFHASLAASTRIRTTRTGSSVVNGSPTTTSVMGVAAPRG
jgi:hypothetical protein